MRGRQDVGVVKHLHKDLLLRLRKGAGGEVRAAYRAAYPTITNTTTAYTSVCTTYTTVTTIIFVIVITTVEVIHIC